jgi:hypothetical protein
LAAALFPHPVGIAVLMTIRFLLVAGLLLVLGGARAETPAEKAGFESKLVIIFKKLRFQGRPMVRSFGR